MHYPSISMYQFILVCVNFLILYQQQDLRWINWVTGPAGQPGPAAVEENAAELGSAKQMESLERRVQETPTVTNTAKRILKDVL